MVTLFTTIGFILAGYSVIANDSVQTLGTWIASNRERFKWTTLWAAAASVLVFTLVYGWYTGDGDISFGRLNKIAYIEPKWYHAPGSIGLGTTHPQGHPGLNLLPRPLRICLHICLGKDANEERRWLWRGGCRGLRPVAWHRSIGQRERTCQ